MYSQVYMYVCVFCKMPKSRQFAKCRDFQAILQNEHEIFNLQLSGHFAKRPILHIDRNMYILVFIRINKFKLFFL